MKRIFIIFCVLMMAVSAFGVSESAPDGYTFSAYKVRYNENSLLDYKVVQYLEPSGLLFSAFNEESEITVSVNERGSAESLNAYLKNYMSNVSRYGKVLTSTDPAPWLDPFGTEGASMQYSYVFTAGADTDSVYQTDVYAAILSANYNLVISVNTWGDNKEEARLQIEREFMNTMTIESVKVSPQYMAYVKEAKEEEGEILLTIDFCTVEFDASIFTIYTSNDKPVDYTYKLSNECMMWGPEESGALYSMKRVNIDEESIMRTLSDYQAANDMHAIYNVVFNENNEIIWLMHYNAF